MLRSHLLWDGGPAGSCLLVRRERVSQHSPDCGIRAVPGELASVTQHLQPCHLLLGVASSSSPSWGSPGATSWQACFSGSGSNPVVPLRAGTSANVLQGPPETPVWCCWYVLPSCPVAPAAPVTLLPRAAPLGAPTSSSAAASRGNAGLWNSDLSSGPCSWVTGSISSAASDYSNSTRLVDLLQTFPSMQDALSRK